MSTTKIANPVTWFEIHTPDRARAKDFYGAVFGWSFDDDPNAPYSMVQLGEDAPIGGGVAQTEPGQTAMTLFNVQVSDVDAALETVASQGGTVVAPAQTTPAGLRFAYVADPDGSVFGLWTPPAG